MSGGGSKEVTVGYKYYVGMHMILCHGPIDNISRIMVDGKTAWSGTNTGGSITIAVPELFGGESREGGISGTVDIAMGSTTQVANDYLQSKIQSDMPAFRGVVGAILRQVYTGLNPYLKPWSFRATRIQTLTRGQAQWYTSKAAIGNDMNPAHILRECLTDTVWGMGYPAVEIDDTSFTAAADKLYSEGFGMSILWDRSKKIDEFITMVLSHIEASLYISRSTGKFVLKLIRADYTVGSLTQLNESNINRIESFKRRTTVELTNQVSVVFWDASTGENNSITVQDTALIQQVGTTIGTSRQYPGITNATIASKVASRDLMSLSTPLASCTIYANRAAANLNIGECFLLDWPQYNMNGIVMRVMNIEFGSLDSNYVKIDCCEDIFNFGNYVYAPPPASAWTNPTQAPTAVVNHLVMDAPYYEIARVSGDTNAQQLSTTSSYVGVSAVRPNTSCINAKLMVSNGSTYDQYGMLDFCPTAVLNVAIAPGDTTWALASAQDIDQVRVGSWAIIDSEIIRIDAISASSVTVGRGCLDTVPAAHSANARIFFAGDFFETDGVERVVGEVVNLKVLPTTGSGTLAIGSATNQQITLTNRQLKPYAPGNFQINSARFPITQYAYGTDFTVSWSHRNRKQQTTTTIYDHTAGNIGPESGTTYTLYVYNAANSLLATYSALTGTSQVVPASTLGTNIGAIKFVLKSTCNGIDSYQSQTWSVTRLSNNLYTDGTVLMLYCEGANGSTVIADDAKNTMTVNGNAQISTAQFKGGTSSLYLDGSGDTVTAPSNTIFDLTTGDWTIETWYYEQTGSLGSIACRRTGGAAGWVLTTAGIRGVINGAGFEGAMSWTAAPQNQWNHIAWVKSGSTLYAFINGVLGATRTGVTAIADQATVFRIGAANDTNENNFKGYIDNFRITKGVAKYTATFDPLDYFDTHAHAVTMLMNMEGADNGVVFKDVRGHAITVGGNTCTKTAVKKLGTSSAYFDGSGDYLAIENLADIQVGSQPFTLEMYVNPNSLQSARLYSHGENGNNVWPIFELSIGVTGSVSFSINHQNANSYVTITSATGLILANDWNHIAVVRNGNEVALYVHGIKRAFTTWANTVYTSPTPAYVGCMLMSGVPNGSPFAGYIDSLRLTKGAARYTADFTPPTIQFPNP